MRSTSAWNPELPPLPEFFGNPMLREGFIEIQPAASIDWRPQTLGWYVVAALLLFWLGRMGWRKTQQWWRNRYRREALQRLGNLGPTASPASVNELLKLVAITASSREEVSALSGSAWSRWLQARCEVNPFSSASLELIENDLYRPGVQADTARYRQLQREAISWVKQHRDDHGPI